MEERFFLWEDDDEHKYCVPVSLKSKIDELDELHPVHNCDSYEEFCEKWDRLFGEIESKLIPVEGILTFSNPKTNKDYALHYS